MYCRIFLDNLKHLYIVNLHMEWVNNIDAYIIKSGRSKKFIAKPLGTPQNQFSAWGEGKYLPFK